MKNNRTKKSDRSRKKPLPNTAQKNTQSMPKSRTYNTTSGRLPYQLSNDYMFRAVFQSRPKALEGLCRSVLHLAETDVVAVELRNPIVLGSRIDSKEFILDLAVVINNTVFLNLEMQMYREKYWVERSLSYACRCYDSLNQGERYEKVLPVVHVGFLKYDLFPDYPEFVSNYQFCNTKNHQVYSDKFQISVVYLNHIELAAQEDKANGIDLWAKVFNATTWEEIDMLAQQNKYLQEAVSGVRQLTEDERIRQQCQAREDYAYWERIKALDLKRTQEALKEQEEIIQQKDEVIQEQEKTIQHLLNQQQKTEAQFAALLARITELESAKK